jgi:hypothetical protein
MWLAAHPIFGAAKQNWPPIRYLLIEWYEKLGNWAFQGRSDFFHTVDRDIFLGPLDGTNVSSMKSTFVGEGLL